MDSESMATYGRFIQFNFQDTGLGVRKRVVKLFRSIYGAEASSDRKIDMCTRLVMRMLDEDDTVKVRVEYLGCFPP